MSQEKVIAFYLPQYHPTEDNNLWWGEGFTEWTNVVKAKPLYRGHYQPKIPSDLGFYDLRLPDVRARQVFLARQAGIDAFCYYHYWFGNGKQELELPFNEVLRLKEPDFPFCLCWANESWSKKFWNKDGAVSGSKTLIKQNYYGHEDNIQHFNSLLQAFKDPRYLRIKGKLLFMIYKPLENQQKILEFISDWKTLASNNGLPGFCFVAYSLHIKEEYQILKSMGFDYICSCRLGYGDESKFTYICRKLTSLIFRTPRKFNYNKIYKKFIGQEEYQSDIFPTLIPNWDHTPRSGRNGYLYFNSTPENFRKHAEQVFSCLSQKDESDRICFLKSWNEWGEGNYMEPDLRYGHGYLDALSVAKNNMTK